METDRIVVRGARVHNLKSVDLTLPKNRLICFTGVSGSGKSSMAFDTIYAEGQRRYIESLSAYARQFMEQMQKPDVDQITGLPPAISIEQKAAGGNPRSTVGTMTEVYDYLRVLYARLGTLFCLQCGKPITGQTRDQILDRVSRFPEGARLNILAPVVRGRQGEFLDLFEDLQKQGFVRARVDGRILSLTEDPGLDRHIKHDVDVVIDRVIMKPDIRSRLAEAVDTALGIGKGTLIVNEVPRRGEGAAQDNPGTDTIMGTAFACAECGISYEEPTPQLFSFNIPTGMCPTCSGLGTYVKINPDLLVTDPAKSLREGALATIDVDRNKWHRHLYEGVLEHFGGANLDTPWQEIPEEARRKLLYGLDRQRIRFRYRRTPGDRGWTHYDTFEGIIPMLERRFRETKDDATKEDLSAFTTQAKCPDCGGTRLRPEARAVRLGGLALPELCALSVEQAHEFLTKLELSETERQIGEDALHEITARLEFLLNVGLRYISLDRTAPTLAGGEAQRIRLASQIGSGLVGVLYVLDEPSIGLHHRDNHRLLNALARLRDLGNTVIVVEHDEDTMRAADLVVDFGPGPGIKGGWIVVAGSIDELKRHEESVTGQFLSGARKIAIPKTRRSPNGLWLEIIGARHNNLKDIDVRVPLGVFTCVTGVSGSGKSSLIADTLMPALQRHFYRARSTPGAHREIRGLEHIDKVIDIDQSPIGRTPRSNPATYTGALDPIRKLFADLPQAKVRGYKPGRFSFNVKGGRCDACDGNGATRVEMDFLADVWVPCPVCGGKRFNAETLQITFKGKTIADVLDMDVQEALAFFEHIPSIRRVLRTLHDVGLDYIKLGQPSTTLSGGEAQRIKLAKELCRRSTGKTLYLLDEPTTGLHFHDISHLLNVLHHFCDEGNSVIVIEHNMDVIKTADWIIDLGPEGGDEGGRVVVVGTPEEVAKAEESWTGQVLRQVLATGRTGGLEPVHTARPGGNGGEGSRAVLALDRDVYRPGERITEISVVGAREHNLKNVSVAIPREKLVVFSGVSGSGKTSMALETIYAEGQRRYVESLSAYARQFLGQMQKPKVDRVEGLSPAIAIEQKSASKNPRSTVGTVTEVYDYLRVIFAQIAEVYCPECRIPAGQQSADEVVERLLGDLAGTRALILAPVEPGRGEDYDAVLARAMKEGYLRARVDGEMVRIEETTTVDKRRTHTIEIVIDRLEIRPEDRGRLGEAVEAAFSRGAGRLIVVPADGGEELGISQHLSCPSCGKSFDRLTPQMFAFNRAHDLSASGMCPACQGMGTQQGLAEEAVLRSERLSVAEGAVSLWGRPSGQFRRMLEAAGAALGFDLETPVNSLSPEARRALFYGDESRWIPLESEGFSFQYLGLFPAIDRTLRAAPQVRDRLGQVLSDIPCGVCGGTRLIPQSRWARLHGVTIGEVCSWPIKKTLAFFRDLVLDEREQKVVGEVLQEIRSRLRFLDEVGLGYVALDRRAPTLSGGEAQRIRLASQVGSGLTGVLYVLDEPTIGLHPRDNRRLLDALEHLRDLDNTVIVVEHDGDTLHAADYVVDFGPGAGRSGGEIVATGPPAALASNGRSLTGEYLSGLRSIPVPARRRPGHGTALEVVGARHHNLQDLAVRFPLGTMIVVTGVSGSGKSTLVTEILYRALAATLHRAQLVPGLHDEVRGIDLVDKVILIDQEPIGTSPLSNPATYSGVFDVLRQLYAQLPEAKVRGYTARRFSTNVPGGRCERCWGYGKRHIEMHFLPDVWVECDACNGMRYNKETLEVLYGGVSIGDVLRMAISEAREHFRRVPRVRKLLQTLCDVGLGYMELGQAASTLSGGEAQRLKLARELARPSTGKTVYILDEPTTGLHFADVSALLEVLNRLVDQGNTVIMIEHNVSVIKSADWIIDLGPEGGEGGGRVVVAGTPETVAACPGSHTGKVLRDALAAGVKADCAGQPATSADDADERADIELDEPPADELSERPPWKADGKAWHTDPERKRGGKRPEWDVEALQYLIRQIEETVPVKVTWSNYFFVTIRPTRYTWGVWCRVHTANWDALRVNFWVPGGLYGEDMLRRRGMEIISRGRNWDGRQWDWIEKSGRTKEAFDSEDFRRFVKNSYARFLLAQEEFVRKRERETGAARDVADDADDGFGDAAFDGEEVGAPWKRDGERWHLDGERLRQGRKPVWKGETVRWLIDEIGKLGKVSVVWTNQHMVSVFPDGGHRFLAIRTNEWRWFHMLFRVPKGSFDGDALRTQIGLRPFNEIDDVPVYGSFPRIRMNGRGKGWTKVAMLGLKREELDTEGFRAFLREAFTRFTEAQTGGKQGRSG